MADLDSGLTDSELVQAVQTTAHQKIKRGTDYLVADGVTDDAVALQALLSMGGNIDLRGMDIAIASNILIVANVDIRIQAEGGRIKKASATRVRNLFEIDHTVSSFSMFGGEIDGSATANVGVQVSCDHVFNGCHIHNFATIVADDTSCIGIKPYRWTEVAVMNDSFHSIVENCHIHNIYGESNSTLADEQGSSRAIRASMSYQQDGSTFSYRNNHIHDIYGEEGDGIEATYSDGSADDVSTKQARVDASDSTLVITGNRIYDCTRRALKIKMIHMTVSDNPMLQLYTAGDPEEVEGTTAATVSCWSNVTGVIMKKVVLTNNNIINNLNALTSPLSVMNVRDVVIANNPGIRNTTAQQKTAILFGGTIESIVVSNNELEGDGLVDWDTDCVLGNVSITNNRHRFRSELFKTPALIDGASGTCDSCVIDNNIFYAGAGDTEPLIIVRYAGVYDFFGDFIASNNKFLRDAGGISPCMLAKFYVLYENVVAGEEYKFLNNYSNGDGSDMFFVYTGADATATVRFGNVKNSAESDALSDQ